VWRRSRGPRSTHSVGARCRLEVKKPKHSKEIRPISQRFGRSTVIANFVPQATALDQQPPWISYSCFGTGNLSGVGEFRAGRKCDSMEVALAAGVLALSAPRGWAEIACRAFVGMSRNDKKTRPKLALSFTRMGGVGDRASITSGANMRVVGTGAVDVGSSGK
jgi:hypothetical protein